MSGFQVISNVRWINFILLPLILSLYGCNDVSEAPEPQPTPPGPGQLTIATSALKVGVVGQPYSDLVSGTGGTTPYVWSVSPALPSNLQLSSSTGTITGTPSGTSSASHTFTLRDSSSPPVQVQKTLQLNVVQPPPVLTILTTTLPAGTINQAYSQTLQAAGGTGTLTWSVITGALPQNFTLNPATGTISGTPTGTSSSTANFTARVADTGGQLDDQALSITINLPPAPSITTTSLSGGTVGTAYNQQVQATGGTGALTWSISAGGLPPGLNINPSSGTISGTPGTAGTYNFTVAATDTFPLTDTQALSIAVSAAPIPPNITTTSLVGGTVGTAYNQTLQRSGGTAPFTWNVTGTLPPGLSINTSTGTISGTPTAPGTFNFTPQITDSLALTDTTPPALSIAVVNPPAPTITTTSLTGGTVGTAYNQTVQASGGTGSRVWGVTSGSLPTSLSLNPSSGLISGTPSSAGTFNFTIQVTDSLSLSDTQGLSIVIAPAPVPPNITTTSLIGGSIGTPYNQTLQRTGGTAPFTWSMTGTLPPGLSLDTSTGTISGTPTGSGTFNFTPHVSDSLALTDTSPPALSIVISASAPTITTTSLPDGTTGVPYSETLTATGGVGTLVWSTASGSPPTNLSLSPSGVISGTPTGTGTANFTVRVTDGFSQNDTQSLSIKITTAAPPLTITTNSPLPNGKVLEIYTALNPLTTLTAAGGTPPYGSWTVSPPLPAGLTLDASSGAIIGAPLADGTTVHTFSVTDTANVTVNKANISLTIDPL